METSNYDTDSVSSQDSLSLLFQKPDRLFGSLDSASKDQSSANDRHALRSKSNTARPSWRTVASSGDNRAPNFSTAFDSTNEESVALKTKKRRSVLKEVNVKTVNFSDAFNSSAGSISQRTKLSYFPKRREITRRSANAFQSPVAWSVPSRRTNDPAGVKVTPPNLSVSFNDSQWMHNPSKTMRRRRCSTPIKLTSAKKSAANEPNVSVIPRTPLFSVQNRSLSSSSPLVSDREPATAQDSGSKSNDRSGSGCTVPGNTSRRGNAAEPHSARTVLNSSAASRKRAAESKRGSYSCPREPSVAVQGRATDDSTDTTSETRRSKTNAGESSRSSNNGDAPAAPAREQSTRGQPKSRGPPSRVTPSPRKLSSHSSASLADVNSTASSNSASLVAKVFGGDRDVTEPAPESPPSPGVAAKPAPPRKKTDFVRRSSVFPKFGSFCGKYFYQFLINKMESKYGIRTRRKVVDVAKYIHHMVEKIISMEDNYHEEVRNMKQRLFRKNVIEKHIDFYYFCQTFLPNPFVVKAVPTIQPMGRPMLAEFDPYTVFDPIES